MVTVRVPTLRPMLASAAAQLPNGPGWSYEVKWDGYRTLALKDGSRVKLLSRNLKDATRLFPTVVREVARLQAESVVLDGEVVAIDDQGRPSFQALHHQSAHTLVFYAFDVLHLDGRNLTATRLDERREMLAQMLQGSRLLHLGPLPGTPAQIERTMTRAKIRAEEPVGGAVCPSQCDCYVPMKGRHTWRS